jgi:hypothetical protein
MASSSCCVGGRVSNSERHQIDGTAGEHAIHQPAHHRTKRSGVPSVGM